MKEKQIYIQIKLSVDLDHEDLEDYLLYMAHHATSMIINEDSIVEDEIFDEDIVFLDENYKVISLDDILKSK